MHHTYHIPLSLEAGTGLFEVAGNETLNLEAKKDTN